MGDVEGSRTDGKNHRFEQAPIIPVDVEGVSIELAGVIETTDKVIDPVFRDRTGMDPQIGRGDIVNNDVEGGRGNPSLSVIRSNDDSLKIRGMIGVGPFPGPSPVGVLDDGSDAGGEGDRIGTGIGPGSGEGGEPPSVVVTEG